MAGQPQRPVAGRGACIADAKESCADKPDATSYNLPVQIAPHVARTMAEASELAHRAIVLANRCTIKRTATLSP